MPRQPTVILTDNERTILETLVHRGKANARTLTRARLLLKSADGWSTSALVTAFDVCEATVTNVRRRFTQGGLEAVLHEKVQQCRRSALSGLQTAHLIAIACSPSPDGHDRLPDAPLGAKSGRVDLCDKHFAYHHSRNAEKTNSSRGNMNIGVCPRSEARRVAAMEDVLDLYEEPYDRKSPTVCPDEKPVVLHAEVHLPVPVEAGQPERVDYEYERKGTRNLFMMVEPLAGWRHVEVTTQRTSAATTPRWFVGWLMRFIRTQSTFDWCRITSILICRLCCMRRFRRVKLAAFCNAWSFITRGIHGRGADMAEIAIAFF